MGCPSHPTHDGGSARAGQTLQHVSLKVVNSAWAGTYGGCVVGQDRQELPRTLHRQVRRLLVVPLLQTLMVGSNTPTPHRCTAFTARRRDTLE